MDLHHTAIDPAPMQPSRTRNRAHYSIYFLSPRKIVVFVRTEGFEYTFCDRFEPEQIYYYTQTVNKDALREEDLSKRLSMFSVNIKVKGRIHALKSLFGVEGKLKKENERQGVADMQRSFEGLGKVLKTSIYKRLEHYLNPAPAEAVLQQLPV